MLPSALLDSMCAGTLIGTAPNNFAAVNAGDRLSSMRSMSDVLDSRMLLIGETICHAGMKGSLLSAPSLTLVRCRLWRGRAHAPAPCCSSHALAENAKAAVSWLMLPLSSCQMHQLQNP